MIDISEWLSSRTSVDSKPTEITNALITIEKGRDSIFQATSKELETGLHSNVRESRSRDARQKDDNVDDDDDYSDDDTDDQENRDFSDSKKIRLNRGTTQHHEPVEELPSRRGLKNIKKKPQPKAAAECLDLSGNVPVYIPANKKVGRPSKHAQRRDLLIRVGIWGGEEAVSTAPLSGKSRRESCLRPYSSVVINR